MGQAIPSLNAQALATLDRPAMGPNSSPLIPYTQEQLKKEMDLPAFYMNTSGSTGEMPRSFLSRVERIKQGTVLYSGTKFSKCSRDMASQSDHVSFFADSQDTPK
jgi:hypothetical protein